MLNDLTVFQKRKIYMLFTFFRILFDIIKLIIFFSKKPKINKVELFRK